MDALKKKKEKRKKIKKKDLEKEDQNVNEERERDKQHGSSIRGKKNESNFIREFHSFLLPPPYPLRPNFLFEFECCQLFIRRSLLHTTNRARL